MNILTKMALGLPGQLKPAPIVGAATGTTHLPPANTTGGLPLMQALAQRQYLREFDPAPLSEQTLSDLLWAAAGINRAALGGRTTPSAMNAQEVDVCVALPTGLYRYAAHAAPRERHGCAPGHGLPGPCGHGTTGPGVCCRLLAHEAGACGAAWVLRVGGGRCHGTKRLPVLRLGRIGHRAPGLTAAHWHRAWG